MTRWAARAAALGLLLLAMWFTATGVAAAHARLISTDPAAGAALNTGPSRVSATFNERLQATFAAMTVVGPDGNLWSTGDVRVDGAVASVAVRPLGPEGGYTVHYRVTSADGHPVTGSWTFRLSTAGTGEPGPPAAAGDPSAPPTPRSHADRLPDDGAGLPVWPFAVGTLIAVGAGLWLARPKS